MTVRRLLASSAVALFAALAAAPRLTAQIQVVDMMPQALSDESGINGEPFLAVDPANIQILAATTFMPTPMGKPNGPLLVSTDGGSTWVERDIIPSSPGSFYNTGDITIRFDSSGTAFYAGILRAGTGNLEVIRTIDMTLNTPMDVLESRPSPDQPYIAARTVTGWYDPGKDRVWVGNNDGSNNPKSATVDQSLDALAGGMPAFTQIRTDGGMPSGRDNYQVRPVASPDGHIYAAFYRRTGAVAGGYNADVVVVREDNWGKTMPPFQSLGAAGVNVVSSVPITDDFSGSFGNEIIGGDLFLTVDLNDASHLYISWAQKTGMDLMTLHVSRSTDFGQTWGADLIAVPSAKNGALAVNSAGRLGYLYQQLTGAMGSRHWQTHLRRSDDGTTWSDVTLSDFPAEGAGSLGGYRIVGDYVNLVAVGKNFYGVFSADNDLVNASFPAGVTFVRNKTPNGVMSPHFLGVDGVTTINPSIDPFFFRTTEIDPRADVYVRDWTDDGTTHDHGQEPSIRNDFYSTSDVWNERTNDPLAFVNDRPQVHDPQPTAMGHNYAFARVSREATGTAVDVALQLYYSDGGVGVPYVSAGAPIPLHLDAGDAAKTVAAGAGLQWELPSGASNHVCLAVEISAPGDPLHGGTLLGHAPGWPTTDLMVVADNNKAQRNMQVFGFGGMSHAQQQAAAYAIIRNAAERVRDMQIGLDVDPKGVDALGGAMVRVLGGRQGGEPQRVVPGGVVTLPAMAPGESRWLEIRFAPTERLTAPLPIRIVELVGGQAVNGYAFVPTPQPLPDAVYATVFQHAAVAMRLAKAFRVKSAEAQVALARRLLAEKRIDPAEYAKLLAAEAKRIQAMTAELLAYGKGAGDPFGAAAAADRLAKATSPGNNDPAAAQILHLTLLNKLDATATYYQKGGGKGR